jgi:hypothetical protein
MKKVLPLILLFATCSSRRQVWLDINGSENVAQLVDFEPHEF